MCSYKTKQERTVVHNNDSLLTNLNINPFYLAELKNLIESRGATFSSAVTNECTHLVTTRKEVDKNSTKR